MMGMGKWPLVVRRWTSRRRLTTTPWLLLAILSAPSVSAALDRDVDRGKRLYENNCVACHALGAAGDWFKAVPALAGQRPEYLRHQLRAFSMNSRKSSSMHWVFSRRPLNHDVDRAALVAYLSKLPAQDPVSGAASGDEALGQKTYEEDCVACHHAQEWDGTSLPIIAGQQYSYLVHRLFDIRDHDQTEPAMRAAVLQLTDAEIAAVANFLSRMKAVQPSQ